MKVYKQNTNTIEDMHLQSTYLKYQKKDMQLIIEPFFFSYFWTFLWRFSYTQMKWNPLKYKEDKDMTDV